MKKFTVILLLAFFSKINSQPHPVPSAWSVETQLPLFDSTKSQKGVLYNNMVVASSGRVYVATVEVNPTSGIASGHYLNYSDDNGFTWLPVPVKINSMNYAIGSSSIKLAIDSDDNIFIVWIAKSPTAIFCTKLRSDLSVVFDTVRVANKILYNNFTPHLTIDKKNRLHVMWHEGDMDLGQTAESFHSRSTDGGLTWSEPQPISSNDGRHSAFPHAQFHLAYGDTLAIGWRDSISSSQKWDVFMVTSTNGGVTWSAPLPVVTGVDYDSDPDIIIDPWNRIHLIFHKYPMSDPFNGAMIKYGYSDNLGIDWLPSGFKKLSENNMRSHLTEGNDYDSLRNILWAVWKDERDFLNGDARADIVVAYSTDRGDSWSTPEFATDWDTLTVGFKAGTLLNNGDLALNYEVFNANGNLTRVYFRKRTTLTTDITEKNLIPSEITLHQNYPNPFNPSTKIKFTIHALTPALSRGERVILKVYDMLGREVTTLVNEELSAGEYEVEFNINNELSTMNNELNSNIYFYRLTAGNFSVTKKFVLLK